MNNNEMPVIITQKDLSYLEDIFSWNKNALTLADAFSNNANEDDVKELLQELYNNHKEHLKAVINILK